MINTAFEKYIIETGDFYSFHFCCKEMKYKKGMEYLSTIGNLSNSHIHKNSKNLLSLIERGVSTMDERFTRTEDDLEIIIGLHEVGFPPRLISPRISIVNVDYIKENKVRVSSCNLDKTEALMRKLGHENYYKAIINKDYYRFVDNNFELLPN